MDDSIEGFMELIAYRKHVGKIAEGEHARGEARRRRMSLRGSFELQKSFWSKVFIDLLR